MRALTKREESLAKLLEFVGVDYTTLQITKTGIEKGYTDATKPFRDFLGRNGIHDYSQQTPGQTFIKAADVFGLTDKGPELLKLSFQRPATKQGRMFRVSVLDSFKRTLGIQEGDVLMFIIRDNQLAVANLTYSAGRTHSHETESMPTKPQGAIIVKIAKDRLIYVMESMPVCEPESGVGARAAEIAELSGMTLERQAGALVNTLLDELCLEGRIEALGKNPRRFRLCHSQ